MINTFNFINLKNKHAAFGVNCSISFSTAVVLLFSVMIPLLVSCRSGDSAAGNPASQVTSDSVLTMIESGQLESVRNSVVSAPGNWRMEYRILYLREEGLFVKQGDTVVVFDPEQAQSQMDEALSMMALKKAKLVEVREKNRLSLEQKKSSIQQIEMEIDINRDKLKNAGFESEVVQQQMALELQKTEQQLKQAQQNLESQQVLNRNNENLTELEIEQAGVQKERARTMMADMYLTAPRDGMVIYQKLGWGSEGEKAKTGITIQPQTPILAIPDLRAMKVIIKLNEVDHQKIRPGISAVVRIEAYPDTIFSGRVSAISRIADFNENSQNVKTYNVDVALDCGENFRLKPGLSAQVTFLSDTLHQVFRVPVWCMDTDGSGNYVITEQSGRITVNVIRRNDGYAYVQGALRNGMALTDIVHFKK
jgi:multidrug efflux pump subunit AcrA (membrane-fusion protein)